MPCLLVICYTHFWVTPAFIFKANYNEHGVTSHKSVIFNWITDTCRSANFPLPDLPSLPHDHDEDGRTVTSPCIPTTFADTVLSKTFRTLTHASLFCLGVEFDTCIVLSQWLPFPSHCWFPYSKQETRVTDNSGPRTHLYSFLVARGVSTPNFLTPVLRRGVSKQNSARSSIRSVQT
jgi:hypothetical protein